MHDKRLMEILDYILNSADASEISAIEAAIQRRQNDLSKGMSIQPGKMAKEMASKVSHDIETPLDNIRSMVKGYVTQIIKQNAPEISDEELQVLLDEYMPEAQRKQKKPGPGVNGDLLYIMVRQFIAYSKGSMPISEQS
ncbi:MAG: hypothetical protein ACLFR1_15910, partial [Spirochaetia bacterium]